MRAARLVCLLCVAAVGCQGVRLRSPLVCDRPVEPACDTHVPCPKPVEPCPPVEVQKTPDVHVTAPTPKVIVNVPEATVVNMPAAQQPAAPTFAPATVPQPAVAPGALTTGLVVSGLLAGSGGLPMGLTPGFTQTSTRQRTRITIGLDTIQIPFPVLRFFPVTGPTEVTTRTEIPQAQVISQPAFVQPAVAAQPVVPVTVQQPVIAQPAQVVQPQPVVVQQPVQSQPVVVQQPVQPQPVQAATVECPPVTKQTLDALQLELDKAKAQLKASQPGSR